MDSVVKCDGMKGIPSDPVSFDPQAIAVRYYFGDLSYWQLPAICVEALERGFDGRALRIIAGLMNPVARDMRQEEIDSAFRDMGVKAPIPKEEARLALAVETARRALSGESNVFDMAMHIWVHICEVRQVPPELQAIVALSAESEHAPRWKWEHLEQQLHAAIADFLRTRRESSAQS